MARAAEEAKAPRTTTLGPAASACELAGTAPMTRAPDGSFGAAATGTRLGVLAGWVVVAACALAAAGADRATAVASAAAAA